MKTQWIGALLAGAALVALPGTGQAQTPDEVAEGAVVYGQQCMRCHTARSPSERTDRQWQTIMAHMRARANLTKAEAAAVEAFLKATNLPEGVSAVQTGSLRPIPSPEKEGAKATKKKSGDGESGSDG